MIVYDATRCFKKLGSSTRTSANNEGKGPRIVTLLTSKDGLD